MREIKFRAWDGKKMYDWAYLQDFPSRWLNKDNREGSFVPMQSTGLKDKNGKEIYEGDIVQHRNWHEAGDGSVRLSKDNEYMEKEVVEYVVKTPFVGFRLSDNDEVVGNIYENPELLIPSNTSNK